MRAFWACGLIIPQGEYLGKKMTKNFFDMLIKCQTTTVNVLQLVYFQSKVE